MPSIAASLAFACLIFADPAGDPPDVVTALENAIADVIAKTEPSVVAITRARDVNREETTAIRGANPAGHPENPRLRNPVVDEFPVPDTIPLPGDFGSGVVVGSDGAILTAYHVIKGAFQITVRAAGRQEFLAEVIAADPRSDLAVIAPRLTPGAPRPKLRPLPIGDASKLRKGSFLISLGNPYNTAKDGKASASWGILSNTTRRMEQPLEFGQETRQMFRYQPTLLQLDTKLNQGMSGGAIVNLKGELVGISTTGGSAEGFDTQAGYAIPIDTLGYRIVETLRQGKEMEYGFLGIGLDNEVPNRVRSALPGTPAAIGGLLAGDTIEEVNGVPVDPPEGLSLALSNVPVGEPVKLKIKRAGNELVSTVMVSKYPVAGQVIATNRPNPWRGIRVDFTSVMAGTLPSDPILDAMTRGCVYVTEVETGSRAEAAGLRKGQVIKEVDGKPVRSPNEFSRAVADKSGAVVLKTELGDVSVK